jgi:hypothetical protein
MMQLLLILALLLEQKILQIVMLQSNATTKRGNISTQVVI